MLGRSIADLHLALRACSDATSASGLATFAPAKTAALDILPTIAAGVAPGEGRRLGRAAALLGTLAAMEDGLPRQIIHRDTHPDNIILCGDELRGFIDFDLATVGPRLFDLCYCATSLLSMAWPSPALRRRWPTLWHRLRAGYEAVAPLKAAERAQAPAMMLAVQCLFIAYLAAPEQATARQANLEMLYWLAERAARLAI